MVAHTDTTSAAVGPSRRLVRSTALGFGVALLLYVVRLDAVCGLFVDDAWYVLLAKALAGGQGYALSNAPSPGILPFYPPGFPWLLSWVFRVAPGFPGNVWLLKAVSIAAMLGVGLLTLRYAVRIAGIDRTLATAIALTTMLHPAFVFLATATVMSECVFTLAQLATVLMVERVARGRGGAVAAGVAGGLAGSTFLVRSMAVGLIGAAGLYLLKERRWRAAVAFAVGVALVAGPWVLHAASHAPTPAQRAEMNDYVVYPYSTHFWSNVAGSPRFGTTTLAELPARTWSIATVVATRDVGALVVYPLYRLIEAGEWVASGRTGAAVSLLAGLVMLVGFGSLARRRIGLAEILVPVSLGTIVLWAFLPFRFVMPLLPFALSYLAIGIRVLAGLVTGRGGRGAAIAVVATLALVGVASNVAYARRLRGPAEARPLWQRIFDEEMGVIQWVHEHVPRDQAVAAHEPAIISLYDDDRKTVGYWQPTGTWKEWRRLGIHYLVDSSWTDDKDESLPEGRFRTAYRSPTMNLRVLDLQRIYDPH